jgi:hypothetical protein
MTVRLKLRLSIASLPTVQIEVRLAGLKLRHSGATEALL